MPLILKVDTQIRDSQQHQTRKMFSSSRLHESLSLNNGYFCGTETIPNQKSQDCDTASTESSLVPEKRVRKNFFPYKLIEMLSSPFFSDCIGWVCEGKAFLIFDPDKFSEKYASFYRRKTISRKESFARKLNRWGFKMELTKGPHCSSYSHPFFIRNEPWLCEKMSCNKKRSLSNINEGYDFDPKAHFEKKRKFSQVMDSEHFDTATILKRKRIENPMLLVPSIPTSFATNIQKIDSQFLLHKMMVHDTLKAKRMVHLLKMRESARHLCPTYESFGPIRDAIVKNAIMALV